MKYLKTINENLNKRYIFKGTTIDITYCDMPKTTKQIIMEKAGGQNTWIKWYPCDGYFKPLSEVNDESKVIYFDDNDDDYVYEIGDEPVSDWLLTEGFTVNDEIVFLVWW